MAFQRGDSSAGNQTHEDNGKKAAHGFTVEEMVSFWWTKMAETGNTNTTHVHGRWLNPAGIKEKFNWDDQISRDREGPHCYFPKKT